MIVSRVLTDKFSESGEKVIRRAFDLSNSLNHHLLSVAHIFTALSDVENELFVQTMRSIGVNPKSVTQLLEQELAKKPQYLGRQVDFPEQTWELLNHAMKRSRSRGSNLIESYDIFAGLFMDPEGLPVDILRRLGIDPVSGAETISQLIRAREEQATNPKRSAAP